MNPLRYAEMTRPRCSSNNIRWRKQEPRSGAVLFFVIAMLGMVSLLAFTSYTLTRIDFRLANNRLREFRAFMNADAGIEFVKNQIEEGINAGVPLDTLASTIHISPPSGLGEEQMVAMSQPIYSRSALSVLTSMLRIVGTVGINPQPGLNLSPPTGLNFDPVTNLTQMADPNLYVFEVIGRDGNSRAVIEATIRQGNAIELGIYGDLDLDFSPNVDVYSYHSDVIQNPTPSDSTGQAIVGSNENLTIMPNVDLDGKYVIGKDPSYITGTYPTGHGVEEVPRIHPDPLGAFGGKVETMIVVSRTQNDNASASFINNSDRLRIWNSSETLTAGTYHLSSGQVKGTLTVDTSGGRVDIFLEGGFETWPGSDINVTGNPNDFRIFSNSSDLIWLRPNNTFKGFVYAPRAEIRIWPGIDFYGAVWGGNVDLHPVGDIYIDMSILDKIKSHRIQVESWKEVRL